MTRRQLSDPQRRLMHAGSGHYKSSRVLGIKCGIANPHMRRASNEKALAEFDAAFGHTASQLANGDAKRWSDDAHQQSESGA